MEANTICGRAKDEDTDQNFTCIVVYMHFIDFFFFVCSFISLPRKTDMERYGSQFHQDIDPSFANIVEQILNL